MRQMLSYIWLYFQPFPSIWLNFSLHRALYWLQLSCDSCPTVRPCQLFCLLVILLTAAVLSNYKALPAVLSTGQITDCSCPVQLSGPASCFVYSDPMHSCSAHMAWPLADILLLLASPKVNWLYCYRLCHVVCHALAAILPNDFIVTGCFWWSVMH